MLHVYFSLSKNSPIIERYISGFCQLRIITPLRSVKSLQCSMFIFRWIKICCFWQARQLFLPIEQRSCQRKTSMETKVKIRTVTDAGLDRSVVAASPLRLASCGMAWCLTLGITGVQLSRIFTSCRSISPQPAADAVDGRSGGKRQSDPFDVCGPS